MVEKPRKLTRQYACWRGTAEHLVEIATVIQREILRAAEAAKDQAFREIDQVLRQKLGTYVAELRRKAGVADGVALPPAQVIELAQAGEAVQLAAEQQRAFQRDFIDQQATKLSFGYIDVGGQHRSSSSPGFLRAVSRSVGVTMQGNLFGTRAGAGITVTIQNKPWETVSLDVSGEDPDWVSSAFVTVNDILARRESSVVGLLRNQWLRDAIGLGLWLLFIPSFEALFHRYGIDTLFAIPASLIAAALLARLFQSLTRPLGITAAEPNPALDIVKASWPPVIGAVASFLLELLVRR